MTSNLHSILRQIPPSGQIGFEGLIAMLLEALTWSSESGPLRHGRPTPKYWQSQRSLRGQIYSLRRATAGSMRDARCAGTKQASAATARRMSDTAVIVVR